MLEYNNLFSFYTKLKDNFITNFFLVDDSNQRLLQHFIQYIKQNKNAHNYLKYNQLVHIYIYMCIHSYITSFDLINIENKMNYNTIILNNKNNQLFISIIKNTTFFKSFSTGYILLYLDLVKKSLKKQTSSYILLLKLLLKMIETFFIKDLFLFNIVGTKKNFFK